MFSGCDAEFFTFLKPLQPAGTNASAAAAAFTMADLQL